MEGSENLWFWAWWANGPVVAHLWKAEKHDWGEPFPSDLSVAQIETLTFVLDHYGHLSGEELMHLTHAERPWKEISEREDAGANEIITRETLRDYFRTDKAAARYGRLRVLADSLAKDHRDDDGLDGYESFTAEAFTARFGT